MRAQDSLAEAIRSNKTLIGRYLKGFSDANHTKQAAGLPNHVAWTLGHIASRNGSMGRVFPSVSL